MVNVVVLGVDIPKTNQLTIGYLGFIGLRYNQLEPDSPPDHFLNSYLLTYIIKKMYKKLKKKKKSMMIPGYLVEEKNKDI